MECRQKQILTIAALALAACGEPRPLTEERAAELCAEEAELADGVSGSVVIAATSDGPRAGSSITITDAIFNPQPEAEALEACIARRMAGAPTPTTVGVTIGGSS